MATIDKLDQSVYTMYAIRTMMIEQLNQSIRLQDASSIPPQTQILDVYPRLTELDILLGIVPLHTPWAYFFPPKKQRVMRRSPFSFSRIAPSLGDSDKQAEDEAIVLSTECASPEETQERAAILGCFKQLNKINSWLGFIVGRVGQFLQG